MESCLATYFLVGAAEMFHKPQLKPSILQHDLTNSYVSDNILVIVARNCTFREKKPKRPTSCNRHLIFRK